MTDPSVTYINPLMGVLVDGKRYGIHMGHHNDCGGPVLVRDTLDAREYRMACDDCGQTFMFMYPDDTAGAEFDAYANWYFGPAEHVLSVDTGLPAQDTP